MRHLSQTRGKKQSALFIKTQQRTGQAERANGRTVTRGINNRYRDCRSTRLALLDCHPEARKPGLLQHLPESVEVFCGIRTEP